MVKNGPFLTVFFFKFLTIFDGFFLNTVTQCDKHFFVNTIIFFLVVNLFLEKIRKGSDNVALFEAFSTPLLHILWYLAYI